ncbi:hypothetical protein [Luteimonas notoginsengisoli]|uniref:Holin n=1 Tax=Luteimonas notoginsengisoli TaxID=1578200 RepID=A0ABV7UQ27_9GAMM
MNQRFDFSFLFKRISTWCALASLSATAALLTYNAWPQRLQDLTADWVLIALGAIGMGAAFLTPIATSYQQKGIPPKTPGTPPAIT